MPRPTDFSDLSPTLQTIVLEAGGEGPIGMQKVAKVMVDRTMLPRWKGLTTDQIVQQPKQFSGWERKDRIAFLSKQPQGVFLEAAKALKRAQAEAKSQGVTADHYVTKELHSSPKRPDWVSKMEVVETYGNHVFLRERR